MCLPDLGDASWYPPGFGEYQGPEKAGSLPHPAPLPGSQVNLEASTPCLLALLPRDAQRKARLSTLTPGVSQIDQAGGEAGRREGNRNQENLLHARITFAISQHTTAQ